MTKNTAAAPQPASLLKLAERYSLTLTPTPRGHKGCCPFHDEVTPSFYIDGGTFLCLGCGASGDAIGFVMRMEKASFPDAVLKLAEIAGVDLQPGT